MKKTITLILILFSIGIHSQVNKNNNEINEIKQQISEINKLNNSQQNKIVELQETKNTTNKIQKEAELIRISTSLSEKRENSLINFLYIIAGLITLVISIVSFLGYKSMKELKIDYDKQITKIKNENLKKIEEFNVQARQQLSEDFNSLRKQNIETINRLIGDKFWEYDLMKKSNIIVFNPQPSEDSKHLNTVLKYFEPINSFSTSFDDPEAINKLIKTHKKDKKDDKLNIVLLENSDGDWNFQKYNEIKEDDPEKESKEKHNIKVSKNIKNAINIASNLPEDCMLMYFGPGSSGQFPTREYQYSSTENAREIINRVSFVNAPSKLYSNLIDTLKFMDIIEQETNA